MTPPVVMTFKFTEGSGYYVLNIFLLKKLCTKHSISMPDISGGWTGGWTGGWSLQEKKHSTIIFEPQDVHLYMNSTKTSAKHDNNIKKEARTCNQDFCHAWHRH